MTQIHRIDTNARMSRVIVHGSTVFVGGLTAQDGSQDIKGQTEQVLSRINDYLNQSGTDKDHVISAQIYLKDIKRDYDGMNEVWDSWFSEGKAPIRACLESELAREDLL